MRSIPLEKDGIWSMTKPWRKKLLCYVLVLLAVLVLLVVVAIDGFRVGSVKLPEVTQIEKGGALGSGLVRRVGCWW